MRPRRKHLVIKKSSLRLIDLFLGMKKIPILFFFLLIHVLLFSQSAKDFSKYVNPFIGSAPLAKSLSGSVFPGACRPFGLVQLSPDTQDAPEDPASGYNYDDKTIVGF